jgi:hypothetical protein
MPDIHTAKDNAAQTNTTTKAVDWGNQRAIRDEKKNTTRSATISPERTARE